MARQPGHELRMRGRATSVTSLERTEHSAFEKRGKCTPSTVCSFMRSAREETPTSEVKNSNQTGAESIAWFCLPTACKAGRVSLSALRPMIKSPASDCGMCSLCGVNAQTQPRHELRMTSRAKSVAPQEGENRTFTRRGARRSCSFMLREESPTSEIKNSKSERAVGLRFLCAFCAGVCVIHTCTHTHSAEKRVLPP